MRVVGVRVVALAAVLLTAVSAAGEQPGWHRNLSDALKAARKSDKPVLVTTIWREGVCETCETWRENVPGDEDVARQIARYEPAEWQYDGVGGKVIKWTKENGGTCDDPAVQAFITDHDGKVLARSSDPNTPSRFARWLRQNADEFERANPRTRSAFEYAEVSVRTVGTSKRTSVSAIDDAEGETPVIVYVARTDRPGDRKPHAAEAKASRRLERKILNTKSVASAAADFVRVRLDLSDADHALYA